MIEVKLSNGIAKISDEWKWKHEKRYMGKMLSGGSSLSGEAFVDSKEEIIKCLLVELKVADKIVEINDATFGDMLVADINILGEACSKVRKGGVPDDEEKKTSNEE